jgi:hypothetical protein
VLCGNGGAIAWRLSQMMTETPIHLAGKAPSEEIEQRAEQVCTDAGLRINNISILV